MCSAQRERGAGTEPSAIAALCAGLEECLHVASQPLTVLRGSLDAEAIGELEDAPLRDLALHCCAEVQRLCDAVNEMRRLLELATTGGM